MQNFLELIHQAPTYNIFWLFYLGYIFITALSGFLKINTIPGRLEIAGAIGLLIGIFYPPFTIIPLIWLLPLSLITISRHFDYNTLYRCVVPLLIVITNRTYGII
jgi:hypothetical protein